MEILEVLKTWNWVIELAIALVCAMNIGTAQSKHARAGWTMALFGWIILFTMSFVHFLKV